MDELVHVQLLLALFLILVLLVLLFLVLLAVLLTATALLLLLLLLTSDSRQVAFVSIEDILHALFAQGLLGVDLVLDLELGQLQFDLFLLLFGLFQQLFQLLAVLDLRFLDLVQAILVFRDDDVHGQLLLLSGDTNDLHLLVFVVVELALALEDLKTRSYANSGLETRKRARNLTWTGFGCWLPNG